MAAFIEDLDLDSHDRYAMYDLWRAVSPPPQDIPIAGCDARTVAAVDEVTVRAITQERAPRSSMTRPVTAPADAPLVLL